VQVLELLIVVSQLGSLIHHLLQLIALEVGRLSQNEIHQANLKL
jgi:hypothetical protein